MDAASTTRHLISGHLSPATIQLCLRGANRDSILAELAALVPDLAGRGPDQERLLRALLDRENMHSTGIGDGIALPHTRDTLGGIVTHPVIVFGRHSSGIPYNAIDGRPVRLFFLLVTTSVTQHLQILARISRVLRDSALREALLSATDPAAVLAALRRAEANG